MSLSASDNAGSFSRIPSGKTPPPAPSAAFHKRAREMEAEERMTGPRYRPPALRGTLGTGNTPGAESDSVNNVSTETPALPPTNFPPGFRRARAGTLPSNVQLAAQRFAAASNNISSTHGSTESFTEQLQQQNTSPTPAPTIRPNLRHSASVATSSILSERNSRLRSGSLTLPSGNMSDAFGSSLFSSSWLTGGGSGFPVLDELRSVASMDSGGDDFDVHTLDYLGLEDVYRTPAATISELRSQAQAAIAGNLTNPPRLRASTVSNPYRVRSFVSGGLLQASNAQDDEEYYEENGFANQHLDSYDDPLATNNFLQPSYVPQNYRQSDHLGTGIGSRPRAISVGNLDESTRLAQRRASVADPNYLGDIANPSVGFSGLPAGILKADKLPTNAPRNVTAVHFPNGEISNSRVSPFLSAPGNNQGGRLSPKNEAPSNQLQTPTRSLWIGNLDSSVTSEQLIHVFAPYGAIESLRLLPEKECGFVNFVDQADAIRAKDDVLNRLGGNIGMPNGQTVRIGFGKADSAPVAPAKGANMNGPISPQPGGVANKNSTNNAGLGGIESQVQSTPTRALWIGSIPSTTTPATILNVFSPFGPIESARVLTHKNCGFINFERLDDAVRARKALNGRDVLGSDVGAIRIGFAKVPTKGNPEGPTMETEIPVNVQGVGDLSVGATIHALRGIKGAGTIPVDQQVLSGSLENYRSNLLLSMIGSGLHNGNSTLDGATRPGTWSPLMTEQQMIMRELSGGSPDAEADIAALAEFRPPTMYYTTIPLVSERPHNRRWDASKLRELRKRMDTSAISIEEIDSVAADFLDGEIVDLASDWLGNTVVQKLFEKCSVGPRLAMLERIAPHLAMIGIHKNGTWAAQKIIECVQSPEEVSLIGQYLRPYVPPLLLDQFGNYVVQCCLRFGSPGNEFLFDAMVDRLWEIAQGRFGARSMRACLESPHITINQQRRIGTAIVLNSIPLATNPNGALLLTWLLDTSGFPSRYMLLAPRFTPHLSHLCTHKLASLTVLRIVNQKVEPEASKQIVEALFQSTNDSVLTDVLGDQVNGVAVVHKILTSSFIDPAEKPTYIEATKRVLIELKVIATQAYRRLIEEVGLPVPNLQPTYSTNIPQPSKRVSPNNFSMPGLPAGYPSSDQGLASMMAALQMGGQNPSAPPRLQIDPTYPQPQGLARTRSGNGQPQQNFSPNTDGFNPFNLRSPDMGNGRNANQQRRNNVISPPVMSPNNPAAPMQYNAPSPNISQAVLGMGQGAAPYNTPPPSVPPQLYQAYMYQMYQQNPATMGAFHA